MTEAQHRQSTGKRQLHLLAQDRLVCLFVAGGGYILVQAGVRSSLSYFNIVRCLFVFDGVYFSFRVCLIKGR